MAKPVTEAVTGQEELLIGLDGAAITLPELTKALRGLEENNGAEVVGVDVESDIVQPGSHTGMLRYHLTNGETCSLFLKKVFPKHRAMADRPWSDRRRTLAYARTETRFYQEFAADASFAAALARTGVRVPRLAQSDNRLEALLGETAVHEPAGEEPPPEVLAHGGALLFLECADGFVQASPLDEAQAACALRAVAALHAAAWEDAPVLERASTRLQRHGGVYALEIRSASELTKIRPNWDNFMASFCDVAPELLARPGIAALGERLELWYRYTSGQVSPSPSDRAATLVHGDFKAMNVMLPGAPSDADTPAMLIDFASCGVGFGMCDVAMLLAHSVAPSTLAAGGQERLIDAYLDALAANGVMGYTRDEAMRHFHLATVDYARFVVARFWGGASAEAFEKRAANPNVCLPNRNVEAALGFAERADQSLRFLEEEGRGP